MTQCLKPRSECLYEKATFHQMFIDSPGTGKLFTASQHTFLN